VARASGFVSVLSGEERAELGCQHRLLLAAAQGGGGGEYDPCSGEGSSTRLLPLLPTDLAFNCTYFLAASLR
jgi:hypothetical protein